MPSSTAADVAILVFARAPVPGRAKTRLAGRLGAWGAARLHRRLTLRTLAVAECAFPGAVELYGTSPHAFFRSLRMTFARQHGRDLGERMERAALGALRRHRAVIIVGTDCPLLEVRDLRRAARLLASYDAVLAPAEDGGYVLIGLSRPRADPFRGIDWGSSRVLAQTVETLHTARVRYRLLRTLWDLDRPEDLERLRALRFSSVSRRVVRR